MAKFLGSFENGARYIDLYVRSGHSAEFNIGPEVGKNARITVGVDEDWYSVLGYMLHEITELTYTDMGLRMIPSIDIAKDNGGYFFVANHTQFSEATGRVGLFLSKAIPALLQHHRENKRKT